LSGAPEAVKIKIVNELMSVTQKLLETLTTACVPKILDLVRWIIEVWLLLHCSYANLLATYIMASNWMLNGAVASRRIQDSAHQ